MWNITITTKGGKVYNTWFATKDLPKMMKQYASNEIITTIKIERASVPVIEAE